VKVVERGVVQTEYCEFFAAPLNAAPDEPAIEPSDAKEKTLPGTRPCAALVVTTGPAAPPTVVATVSDVAVLVTMTIDA